MQKLTLCARCPATWFRRALFRVPHRSAEATHLESIGAQKLFTAHQLTSPINR